MSKNQFKIKHHTRTAERYDENDRRTFFMVNLHQSMGRAGIELPARTCSRARYRLMNSSTRTFVSGLTQ